MKDLSREEKLEQRILELERLIEAKCDEYSNKKWLRVKRTFFVLSGVLYLIELYCGLKYGISDIDMGAIFGMLVAPLFAAGFIMFISYGVLYYITDNSIKEEMEIAKLEGKLNALKSSKYNTCEDKTIEEIENQLEDLRILLAPIIKVKEKLNLEDLKILLEPIIEEYHFIKVKERLDNEVNLNEKD